MSGPGWRAPVLGPRVSELHAHFGVGEERVVAEGGHPVALSGCEDVPPPRNLDFAPLGPWHAGSHNFTTVGASGRARRGAMECPVCGLDLSSWTLPDAEAHADGCLDLARPVDAATGTEERGARELRVPSSGCPPAHRRGPSPAAGSWTEEAELRGDAGDAAAPTTRGEPEGTRVEGDGMTDAERHDDDWLRLAMAMSASLADAENARVMATSGDYGWMTAPSGEEGADRAGRLVEHRAATKSSNGAAPRESRSNKTPLADSTNAGVSGAADEGRGARGGEMVEMPEADAVEMPKAIRFAIRAGRRRRGGDDDDYDYDDDGDDGNELDAGLDATQRTRRRIRAPLWSMAGHGGRDEPLPDSLLARCLGK